MKILIIRVSYQCEDVYYFIFKKKTFVQIVLNVINNFKNMAPII